MSSKTKDKVYYWPGYIWREYMEFMRDAYLGELIASHLAGGLLFGTGVLIAFNIIRLLLHFPVVLLLLVLFFGFIFTMRMLAKREKT